MSKNKSVLDTNTLLRLLVGDVPAQVKLTERLLSRAEANSLVVSDVVVMEIVFALLWAYKRTKVQVIRDLEFLLNQPSLNLNNQVIARALELYDENNISWVDAYLLAFTRSGGYDHLYSFDRALIKVDKLKIVEPA